MTDPTYDVMPMGVVEAIDPYPFHGLIYDNDTGAPLYLLPMGAGAARLVPAAPSTDAAFLPSYAPSLDGYLWDIGRPDPIVTPNIQAASGKASGKRIIARSNDFPLRLGDKTHQIRVEAQGAGPGFLEDPFAVYFKRVGEFGDGTKIGEFGPADFGFSFSSLCNEQGFAYTEIGFVFGLSLNTTPIAVTPDGAKRAFIASIGYPVAGRFVSAPVGVVEVVFSLNMAGDVTATASVVEQYSSSAGSFEEVVNNALDAVGRGSASSSIKRTGRIVGGHYSAGSLVFYRRDQQKDLSVSSSRSGSTTSWTSNAEYEDKCSLGALSVGASVASFFSAIGTDGVGTETRTYTSSAAPTRVFASPDSGDRTFGGYRAAVIPAGFKVVPDYEPLSTNIHALLFVGGLRGWQSYMVADDIGSQKADLFRLPMLTPSGLMLTTKREASVDKATPQTPYVYGGAYNPATGQAARKDDYPGARIIGWI